MNPVLTAYVGDNGDLFKEALPLFVKVGARVIDMTYGKGVFWKKVETSLYSLIRNDLDQNRGDVHHDFRDLPYESFSFDCAVLDPPYASRSSNKRSIVGSMYNNHLHRLDTVEDMLKFYSDGMKEAHRILKKNGILFVKCQDEISAGRQRRNHISIWEDALRIGFTDEDMFTLVQEQTPIMRHDYQFHARKNNSFLWVFRKK